MSRAFQRMAGMSMCTTVPTYRRRRALVQSPVATWCKLTRRPLAPIRLANAGSCPSRLALIRPANAAAQLVLRTQARRKEEGPTALLHRSRPYNDHDSYEQGE